MEVRLGPELYSAYRVIQAFYIDNDALPTQKTLAKLLKVSNDKAQELLTRLKEKKVITVNSQKGYMWFRGRQVLCTNQRLGEARYNSISKHE